MPTLKRNFVIPDAQENAAINAGIKADPDTYELNDEEFKQLKPMRGRPVGSKAERTKVAVSMRLDSEVLDFFKSDGRGWQTRINETLKAAILQSHK